MAYTITEAQAATLLRIADALVGKQIKCGLISESDRNDYIQELMLIMVQHQNDWTVPDGVCFEAYANTVMEKRLINIWKKNHLQKDVLHDAVSLNATFSNDDGEEEEFINRLTENGMLNTNAEISANWSKGRLIAEVRLFVATLPEEERKLCEILMHESVWNNVAKIMGKHRHIVWRMIQRIRKKMELAGLNYKKNEKKLVQGVTKLGGNLDNHRCKDSAFQNTERKQNEY